jgi:hypothetical protein
MNATGNTARSTIVGMYQEKMYSLRYRIQTNHRWETTWVQIQLQVDNRAEQFFFDRDENGSWKNKDGRLIADLEGCTEPDISLSPFTNTLAINRLKLKNNEAETIKVVFFDILEHRLKPAFQTYTRLSDSTYHFETAEKDFQVIITVDEHGLVVDYPELFVRTSMIDSDYSI